MKHFNMLKKKNTINKSWSLKKFFLFLCFDEMFLFSLDGWGVMAAVVTWAQRFRFTASPLTYRCKHAVSRGADVFRSCRRRVCQLETLKLPGVTCSQLSFSAAFQVPKIRGVGAPQALWTLNCSFVAQWLQVIICVATADMQGML